MSWKELEPQQSNCPGFQGSGVQVPTLTERTLPGLQHCAHMSVRLTSTLTFCVGCVCFLVVAEEMEAQVWNIPKVTERERQNWESNPICLLDPVFAAVPPA